VRARRLAYPGMYLIYSLLFTVGVIVAAPYYLWRRTGSILAGAGWRERFGFLPDSFPPPVQRREAGAIWIHAVSVGETLAVTGLVRELRQRYPERKIFMSHVTPAGRAMGEARLSARPTTEAGATVAGRFYLPLDWTCSAQRALERLRPVVLVLVETELWPNLLRAAHRLGSRVVLVNARLSDRSFRGYRLIGPFMRRVLENVDRVCAQTESDARRFQLLGAPASRVVVTGNLKFDASPPELGQLPRLLKRALTAAGRSPVLVAASTMPREEPLVLEAWNEVQRSHPRALLVLAPRHPTRFEPVAQRLARSGLCFVRRTALEPSGPELASQLETPRILLLNTLGELAGLLEVADLVFMGGSLVRTGGHNPLEAAFWSKPMVFGPYMHNFRDIASRLLEAGAAIQVRDSRELARVSLELLGDGERRTRMGEMAHRLLESESGATARVLEHLQEFLETA
jgi:3-deoxy-D-manno-octulosonic-acid transferase